MTECPATDSCRVGVVAHLFYLCRAENCGRVHPPYHGRGDQNAVNILRNLGIAMDVRCQRPTAATPKSNALIAPPRRRAKQPNQGISRRTVWKKTARSNI